MASMGLWEGVPLRVVLWMTRPVENLRRVFYYGYHNDDLESPMKTFAYFSHVPSTTKAGVPIAVAGLGQVGISGLAKVQVWLHPVGVALASDDPHFRRGDWQDTDILEPPERWGGGLPDGQLPGTPLRNRCRDHSQSPGG